MGRPSSYTPEIADEILTRIAEGESLRAICEDEHLPSRVSVRRWLYMDGSEYDDFRIRYTRAREEQGDAYAERVISESEKAAGKDSAGVQAQKLLVDSLKWCAARLASKQWGDKVKQEISGPDGGPVQTVRRVEMVVVDDSDGVED